MLSIGSIVWGAADVDRAVAFWTRALDYVERDPGDDTWRILRPREGEGQQLAIAKAASPGPRRHHLDLYADDRSAEIDRLIALGAVRDEHWNYEDDADYVVLHDTEGNAFCVVGT